MTVEVKERYERNGWPSQDRPDAKPPEGWSLSLITGLNRVYNHRLSPDGEQIAFLWDREGQTDVYVMPASGGWPARVTTDRPAYQYWWEEIPRWSPDSRWLAFSIGKHVYVAPAEGGLPRKVSGFTAAASSPVWMPDSRGLIVSVEQDEANQLLLTDRGGSWPRLLSDTRGDDGDARPSPDGGQILYTHRAFDDLNRWELRLLDLSTGASRLLCGEPGQRSLHGRWSPDGKQVAFLSQKSGFYEVWLADPAGGEPRQLTHAGKDLGDLAWSPDGRWLAAVINQDGAVNLTLVDAASGALIPLRAGPGSHAEPNWSPAGDFITFEYNSPIRPPEIYRAPVDLAAPGPLAEENVRALTFTNLPALAKLPLVSPEPVSFKSFDGLEIHGLLYRPPKPNGAGIAHPHGGPRDQYTYHWDLFAQYLVAKGYTYLAVNYRGGSGYGRDFEMLNQDAWGMGDTQDCLQAASFLAAQPGMDPSRLAIMGGSYGGYMTICSLSWDPEHRYACGVAIYGDADLFNSWALCDRSTRLYTEMQLGHPSRAQKIYRAGSPIHAVENVQKPVLVLHGLDDPVVPPSSSEEWVEALKRAGKTYEYKTYAGESHGWLKREVVQDVYRRIERFLDWYLI